LERKQRFYQGIPVQDAKTHLFVQPSQEDIQQAIPGDPENCAYALFIKRSLQSPLVRIYKTVAYVQVLNPKGEPVIERFMIPPYNPASDFMNKIDQQQSLGSAGFYLSKPSQKDQLDHRAKYRKTHSRQTKINKEKYLKNKLIGSSLPETPLPKWRHGSGKVQFIGSQKLTTLAKTS
jgi:hypothetical protein